MTESESSFNLNCFEDDFDKHFMEINEYYEYLQTADYIELNWKGRRGNIEKKTDEKETANFSQTPPKESNQKMEFDFEEEGATSIKLNQLNRPKAFNSNKKKTTSATTFNSVMEKIKKRS